MHDVATSTRPRSSRPTPDLRRNDEGTPDRILCLDTETVAAGVPAEWPAEKMPKSFWHTVVCISYVDARIVRDPVTGLETYVVENVASGGEPSWDERQLVAGFWQFFAKTCFRVVTWNGRSFDAPVLLSRAFVHGIATPAWYRRGGKWDGYTKRYSSEFHADVMDLLSSHGATAPMSLDQAAAALRLPGKLEQGSSVAELMANGEIERVRRYCEIDTLLTYVLYVRFALLSGRSDKAGHDASLASLAAYLEAHRADRPYLGAFLDGWVRGGSAPGQGVPGPKKIVVGSENISSSPECGQIGHESQVDFVDSLCRDSRRPTPRRRPSEGPFPCENDCGP